MLVGGLLALFFTGRGGGAVRAEGETRRVEVTAVAPEVAVKPAARVMALTPVAPASEAAARGLPMKHVPRADLAFLAEAARLEKGSRPAAIDELVRLAQGGADAETLRAAADRLLADRLALELAARRWIVARGGDRPEAPTPPRPARALVDGSETSTP